MSPTFSNRRQRTLDSLLTRLLQDHMAEVKWIHSLISIFLMVFDKTYSQTVVSIKVFVNDTKGAKCFYHVQQH